MQGNLALNPKLYVRVLWVGVYKDGRGFGFRLWGLRV